MGATQPSARLTELDVLRGFALLGILTMNITLALPGPARLEPTIAGGFSGWNFAVWVVGYLLFDEKMITLFAMLFGAGILLIGAKSGSPGRVFVRRQLILLGIGLVHAYLIWEGDILVYYALCGLVVYPLRRLQPRTLLQVALMVWLPSPVASYLVGGVFEASRLAQVRVEAAQAVGQRALQADVVAGAAWREFHPDAAGVERLIEENRRLSWWQLVMHRAPETLGFQAMVFFSSFLWTVSARMLIGMALYKRFIQGGVQPARFFLRAAVIFYVAGLAIVFLTMVALLKHQFDPVFLFQVALHTNQIGSLVVAIGHASLILWLSGAGYFGFLFSLLAAVGRMALSNYLLQSLVATTIFYGYGLGQFGRWDRVHLAFLVLDIWALQLALSSSWLSLFDFGPVEWLWRSLTYGKAQPMQRAVWSKL